MNRVGDTSGTPCNHRVQAKKLDQGDCQQRICELRFDPLNQVRFGSKSGVN